MKKLRNIATLLVSILMIGITLYVLTETPAPARDAKVVYTPSAVFDSAVGMIDTVIKPRLDEPKLFSE